MLEPTNYDLDPETASNCLSGNQLKVYELLWRSAVATNLDGPVIRTHQLSKAITDKVSLRLNWKEMLEPGWCDLISTNFAEERFGDGVYFCYESMPSVIPKYNKNTLFSNSNMRDIDFSFSENANISIQVKVKPQKSLTYSSLLDQIVVYKVARPSTYANALNSVIKNDLLLKDENSLFISSNGAAIHEKILKLPENEQLNCNFSYDVETAIEQIEQSSSDAGSLLNQFCQQLFNCDTGLAKWIDALEIDGQILTNTNDNNNSALSDGDRENKVVKEQEKSETSPLDYIVEKVQNFSKINWHEHVWDDYSFTSNILDKTFLGRLKTRKARRLDTSKEQIFEEHVSDFVSIVHIGLCGSIPMMDILKNAEFYILTDRTKGFGYLENLKLVYHKDIYELSFEKIKKSLVYGLEETQFHCMRLDFDADSFLEVEFE